MSKAVRTIFYSILLLSFSYGKVYIEANSIINTSKDTIIAKGNVVIEEGNRKIFSDEVIYNKKTGKLNFTGEFTFKTKSATIIAKKGWYDEKKKYGEFYDAKIYLKGQYFIKAKKVIKVGEQFFYESAKFSSCPFDRYDWFVYSSSGKIKKDDYLYAKNMVFLFCYVPMFYTPFFAYPTSKRKTGLLPIMVSQDIYNDYILKIPFFLVIDRTSDLTFTYDYRNKQGSGYSLEYRKKFSSLNDFRFYGYYFKDSESNEWWQGRAKPYKNRWLVQSQLNIRKYNNFKIFFTLEIPSDSYFYEDFFNTFNTGYLSFVNTRYISYNKSQLFLLWNKQDYSLEVNFDYIYDLSKPDNKETLQRLPEVRFYWKQRPINENLGLYYDFLTVNTHFFREKGQKGLRSDNILRFNWSGKYKIFTNLLEIAPRHTIYSNIEDNNIDNQNRSIISIKNSIVIDFFKKYSFFYHHILPILQFSYVNEKNQDNLPKFDKEDRIFPKKDLDISLFNILNFENGNYFRWEVSTGWSFINKYYIGENQFDGNKKPIKNSLIFGFGFISGENNLFYDQNLKKITRSISGLNIRINRYIGYSVNHSYDVGENKIAQNQLVNTLNLNYGYFSLSGTLVHNLEDNYLQQRRGNFIFNRGCWNMQISYLEDFNKATNKSYKTITFTLNLLGFRYALPILEPKN